MIMEKLIRVGGFTDEKINWICLLFYDYFFLTGCNKKADTISVVTETESQSQEESQTKMENQSQSENQSQGETQSETDSQSQVSTDTETQKQTEETPAVIRNIKAVEEVMPKDFS